MSYGNRLRSQVLSETFVSMTTTSYLKEEVTNGRCPINHWHFVHKLHRIAECTMEENGANTDNNHNQHHEMASEMSKYRESESIKRGVKYDVIRKSAIRLFIDKKPDEVE